MSWRGEMRKAGFGSFGVGNRMDYRGNFTADNIIGFPRKYLYVDANNGTAGAPATSATSAIDTIQGAVDIANLDSTYLTYDTDIFIAGGLYTENVHITKADAVTAGATEAMLLWTAGGTNVGGIGKIRLIATGYVFLIGVATVAQPPLYVGRPNVEIHNFSTIKCNTTVGSYPITKTNWADADGGTSVHMQMPCVLVSDDYNMGAAGGDTLDYGAGNAVKIVNCKINGGTGAGGILNNGAKWVEALGCRIEYYTEYGVANVGSSKGTAAENLTRGCDFHQQVSGAALVHGQAVIWWVDDCRFWDESPTKVLARQAQNSNSSYCWITNSYLHDEDDLEGTNNSGWDAAGIVTALNGASQGSDDLTSDNWV